MKRKVFQVFVLLRLCLLFSFQSTKTSYYKLETPYTGTTQLNTTTVRSAIECSVICSSPNCVSFLFDTTTKVCTTYGNFSHGETVNGTSSLRTSKLARSESLVDCGDLSCFECSGVYRITPVPGTSFDVYCDTETSGGPWTVIQRRFDGSVNFTRNWEDYKRGFGTPYGEYWLAFRKRNDLRSSVQLVIGLLLSFFVNTTLGLEYIHSLLTLDQRLNVKLEGWDGTVRTAAYRKFIIESESDLYQLTIDGFTGDVDDQLTQHNRQRFSTYDRDNDLSTGGSCADSGRGGWWYKNCYTANLNGVYAFDKGIDVSYSMHWLYFYPYRSQIPLRNCSMMIKRKRN